MTARDGAAMRPVSARQAASITLGMITTALVWLCPLLLVVSIAGPWPLEQVRRDTTWGAEVYEGDNVTVFVPFGGGSGPGWPLVLIPLSGILLFLWLIVGYIRAYSAAERWVTMAVAASWFAVIAAVLLTATDVVPASLGLGDWTGHGLGGFHYQSQAGDVRRWGWGWGAGLAWWASVGGMIGCLLDLCRAVVEARRQRRITASSLP